MIASSLIQHGSKFGPVETQRYLRAGYRLIGTHSGVQICRWTRAALMGRRLCYKRWYGIRSQRCIQLTPALQFCNFQCVFCWRFHSPDRFKAEPAWDPPNVIIDRAIVAQRKLLSGFKANPSVTKERFEESMNPVHVAISLDGEPTLYPMIADLVEEISRRGMTSFLVTNGTMPNRLQEMAKRGVEPTNLYVSVYGPDKETYEKVARPLITDAWENVRTSLKAMSSFRHARTVVRLTMVKGQNMHKPESYSRLLEEANPSVLELKGYSWLGESKQRLPMEAMPYQPEIREFAKKIAVATGYEIMAEDSVSRVVVLGQDRAAIDLSLDSV